MRRAAPAFFLFRLVKKSIKVKIYNLYIISLFALYDGTLRVRKIHFSAIRSQFFGILGISALDMRRLKIYNI